VKILRQIGHGGECQDSLCSLSLNEKEKGGLRWKIRFWFHKPTKNSLTHKTSFLENKLEMGITNIILGSIY